MGIKHTDKAKCDHCGYIVDGVEIQYVGNGNFKDVNGKKIWWMCRLCLKEQ